MSTLVLEIADDADLLLVMSVAIRLGGKCSLVQPGDSATAEAQLTKLRTFAESWSKEQLDQIIPTIEAARQEAQRRGLPKAETDS